MKNLLLTGCFSYTEEQLAKIRTLGYHIYFMQQEADGLPVAASDIDAIVCNGLFLSHPIEEFTRLRFIQLTSAGLDRVPLDEIRKRQIKLCKFNLSWRLLKFTFTYNPVIKRPVILKFKCTD